MSIRPLSDVVLVRMDPPQRRSEVLFTPNDEDVPVRTGTVLRVGPGRRKLKHRAKDQTTFIPTQLREGERVVFFAAAAKTKKGRLPIQHLEDDQALIREEDVLCVFEGEGLQVGV